MIDQNKLNKVLGDATKKGSLRVLGDPGSLCVVTQWISSGCLPIDLIMGGGFPIGRITEVYGEESSGKSLLATQAVIEAQRLGMLTAYADVESAVNVPLMEHLGVDVSQLIYYNPDTINELFQTLEGIINGKNEELGKEVPMLFVWDSVAATTTMQELEEGDLDQRQYASAAPQISRALRKYGRLLSKSSVCCIFTNQVKQKLGVVFGDTDTTFGGKAVGFHASVRMKLTTGQYIKSNDRRVGKWVHVETKKNKMTAPMQRCSVPLYFGDGFFEDEALIPFGVMIGAIESSKNGRYTMDLEGEEITFTKKTWPDVLDEHYAEVGQEITEVYQEYKRGE